MRGKRRDILINMAAVILAGLTALAFVRAIWISLDIDESYAVACAYRLTRGDRLIRDMWEPHQLSAVLPALFAAPYIRIRGNTDGLVIYLRLIGMLIHTGMGIFLYRQLKRSTDRRFAFCMLLLHLNYLPKWVQMPEFELMHYWCLLGIFLVLHAYFTAEKPRMALPFIGGCLLTGSLFSYPTMILLYPFYLLAICLLEKQHFPESGRPWKCCGFFTLGAFLPGAAFLGYLFSYMSFDEIKRYISYIFLDTSHNVYTVGEKWAMYAGQIREQAKWCGIYLLLAAATVLTVCLAVRFLLQSRDKRAFLPQSRDEKTFLLQSRDKRAFPPQSRDEKAFRRRAGMKRLFTAEQGLERDGKFSAAVAVLLLTGVLLQLKGLYGFLLGDENQFFFQARYMAVLLPAIVLCLRFRKSGFHKSMKLWLYLCILPSLVSLGAVLLMTNMDTNTAYAKVFLGVLGSFLVFYESVRKNVEDSSREENVQGTLSLPGEKYAGHSVSAWEKNMQGTLSLPWRKMCRALCLCLGGLVLAGLLICRLVLIRVSGCLPVTVLAPMDRVENGPGKGIYVLQETAGRWNDNSRELESLVDVGDRVLYIGAESLVYAELEAVPATPSTQGTAVYNEMFLRYYEEHPERIPNVIVYDRSFGEDPVYALYYSYSLQYPQFLQWLKQNYRDGQVTETEHLIVVRKE